MPFQRQQGLQLSPILADLAVGISSPCSTEVFQFNPHPPQVSLFKLSALQTMQALQVCLISAKPAQNSLLVSSLLE